MRALVLPWHASARPGHATARRRRHHGRSLRLPDELPRGARTEEKKKGGGAKLTQGLGEALERVGEEVDGVLGLGEDDDRGDVHGTGASSRSYSRPAARKRD